MSRYWDKSEQRYAELESRLRKVEEALRKMAEHLREGVRETGGSYDEPPQPADAWSDRAATLLNFYGDILRDTAPSDYERFKASSPENAALLDAEERVLAAEQRAAEAEAALTQIAAWSWDSGSTPAPEVVSRIYCEARAALRDTAPSEDRHWQNDDDPDPGRAQTAYQAGVEREKP